MSGGRWSFVSGQQCLLERSEGKYKGNTIGKADGHVLLDGQDHNDCRNGL